jgi:hypothetical protein
MSIERDSRVAKQVFRGRKPFDVLVEWRCLKESGEDRTSFELFVAGVWSWEADMWRFLDALADGK